VLRAADARLIAAAPEMLEALRKAAGVLREGPVYARAVSYGVDYVLQETDAIIAKAQALLHEIGASYEDVDNHIDMIVQEHCAGLDEFAWEIDEVTQYLNEPVETE
jgi:hypothetical protein